MLRSMYSGITGLRNFQTKLDVIGNNIANVNTYGFKKGRTVFKDLVSQTTSGASAPGANRGGVNPQQIGLGSQIAAIDTLHGQGSSQFTGNTLDLSITGDGFFQVMDGNETLYTRAGNFYMDQNGDLVDGDGRYVVGTDGIINIPESASSMSVGQDGTVFYVDLPDGAEAAIRAAEAAFKGPERDFKALEKKLNDAKDDLKVAVKDLKEADKAVDKAQLDVERYELALEAAKANFPPGSAEIVKADENLDEAKKVLGAVTIPGPPEVLGTGALGAQEVAIADEEKATNDLKTATEEYDDGKKIYDPLKAAYDKVLADNKAVLMEAGQIEMATFSNPGGLEKAGGNLFRASANSGDVNTGAAMDQGFGTMQSGFVEMSNVDLAEEFTEMIVAQRGFQANTRIITTSDEILQELVNLKR